MALKAREILRGATSLALFAAFGIGSLILSPVMLVLSRPDRSQPLVRPVWKLLVWFFVHTGLIAIDWGNLPPCRGTIVVANHPSLIDVVLLTALMPRLISVSKRAVRRNPFMGLVARAVSVPVGADMLDAVSPYLAKGWNVLVFPEGTRSTMTGLHPFTRGAAQMALRTGAPVMCVGIRMSRRLLAKYQHVWDMGSARVTCAFRADRPQREAVQSGESLHGAARRVTQTLEARVRRLLA